MRLWWCKISANVLDIDRIWNQTNTAWAPGTITLWFGISANVPSMKTTKHPSYFRLHHFLSPLKHNLNIIKVNLHNPWATFVTDGEFLSTAHRRSNFCSGRFHTSKSRRFVRITCAKRKATAPKVCYPKNVSETYSTCVQEMMRKMQYQSQGSPAGLWMMQTDVEAHLTLGFRSAFYTPRSQQQLMVFAGQAWRDLDWNRAKNR